MKKLWLAYAALSGAAIYLYLSAIARDWQAALCAFVAILCAHTADAIFRDHLRAPAAAWLDAFLRRRLGWLFFRWRG